VVFIAVFAWGFEGFLDMRQAPKDVVEVKATATKWNWQFTYKNGETSPVLHVPIGRDVRILIQSMDVLHSLSIPAFRVKMDAVPGRYTDLWFRATKQGTYPIFCTEYCGQRHSEMLSEATVESEADFTDWVDGLGGDLDPIAMGQKQYNDRGCKTCHSIDGTPKVGPTWKGLFGSERKLTDGSSATADENYLRQSILEPNAQVVQGFTPSMPTFQGQLKDKHIDGIIAYIKTLK
jgi:cytochrome c oxidase subunit 2